jgi:hypothetical protein
VTTILCDLYDCIHHRSRADTRPGSRLCGATTIHFMNTDTGLKCDTYMPMPGILKEHLRKEDAKVQAGRRQKG